MITVGIGETAANLKQLCERAYQTREPILLIRHGIPFVRIEPVFSSPPSSSEIWSQRQRFIERYGDLSIDFEPPSREALIRNNLFDE